MAERPTIPIQSCQSSSFSFDCARTFTSTHFFFHPPRPSANITFLFVKGHHSFHLLQPDVLTNMTHMCFEIPLAAYLFPKQALLKLRMLMKSSPLPRLCKVPPFHFHSPSCSYLMFLYIGQTVLIFVTILLLFQMEKEICIGLFFF